jgi:heme/copper-type cytochrome/quinol oxidase subunit 2
MKVLERITLKISALATTAFLIGINTAFGATTGTSSSSSSSGALTEAIGEQAQQLSEASKQGIASGKWVVAFVMFILFFLFIILGGAFTYWFYKKTRGNPQQPADERMALVWGIVGAILGLVLWSFLQIVIYKKLGISVVDMFKQAS